nr:hypothetical protein [Tanacetum cinerariifolium]
MTTAHQIFGAAAWGIVSMTRSTVKRLTKPLDEPEREFQRLRRAALRLHQNDSLAIAGRNLFDDEASSGSHEADECEQNHPSEQVYLSKGDIYDDPSLLRFNQNNDTSPWGNSKCKEKGKDGPEWTVRTIDRNKTPKLEARTLAITTRSGISTRNPLFPTLPWATTDSSTEGKTKKENPKDTEKGTIPELVPHSPILYQPSRTSNLPFPSRLKKQNKDDEDERLLSIFKQIQINLPFLEAMIHMPKGAKVLKDLLSHKEKLKKAATLVILIHHDGKWTEVDDEEDSNNALAVSLYPRAEPVKPLKWKALKNRLKPSSVEPPKLELKELPEHLEYAFLQNAINS